MTETGRRVTALAVGSLLGLACYLLLARFAPVPFGRGSILPHSFSLMLAFSGGLAVMAGLADSGPVWRTRRNVALVASVVATGVVLGVLLTLDGDGLNRKLFDEWIPWLAGSALLVWVAAFFLERKRQRALPSLTAVLFGLALAAVLLQNGRYLFDSMTGTRVRAWNVYHYYTGSKYFPELGYFDLYQATLAADDDWQKRKKTQGTPRAERIEMMRQPDFSTIGEARDQRDSKVKPRATIVGEFDRTRISAERLEELGRDTRYLRRFLGMRKPGWNETFKDHGYNPGPAWTVVGTPLSNLISTGDRAFWIIVNSDVPLYLLGFLMIWWAFGLRSAAVMTLWLNTIDFNEARFTGGFLQYDWLISSVCAFALYRRGWFAGAGAAISWGAMTRVFPGMLLAPLLIRFGIDLLRRRPQAQHVRFTAGLVVSCALLFGASHLTGQGLHTWPDWAAKIGKHSKQHPVTSYQRIGVGRMAIHQPSDKRFWDSRPGSRSERLADSLPTRRVLQLIGLALLVPALWRRRDLDGMGLMLFGIFILVTVSRYYASTWALLFLLGAADRSSGEEEDDHRIRWPALLAGGTLLAIAGGFYLPDRPASAYYIANYAVYGMFCLLCLGWIYGDFIHPRRRALDGIRDPDEISRIRT